MGFFLEKQKTGSTPYILIDEEKGYMRFEGESFHENVSAFFEEASKWLKDYLQTDFDRLTFDCELEYFNSSTAKLLLNMLMDMNTRARENKKIIANWITTGENDIIIECGEDFREEMDSLEFNLIIK